jgi:cytosine/creatinine deaminase
MDDGFDIVIRHAHLRGASGARAQIGIKDGRVAAIAPRLEGKGATEIDARDNLVTESFVNPHLHLCKVWTLPVMEEEALKAYQADGMGNTLLGGELASKIKEKYAESWIVENARRAVALAALHGNLHLRAFADVDG